MEFHEKRYYLPIELANELNRNVQTIRRWMREGFIQGVKIRGTWMIPKDEYSRFLKTGNPQN
jgi:predicted site-specific integrase-resolvase